MKTLIRPFVILLAFAALYSYSTAQNLPQAIEIDSPEFDDGAAGMALLIAEGEAYLEERSNPDIPVFDQDSEIEEMVAQGELVLNNRDEATLLLNEKIRESALNEELISYETSIQGDEIHIRCIKGNEQYNYPVILESKGDLREIDIEALALRLEQSLEASVEVLAEVEAIIIRADETIVIKHKKYNPEHNAQTNQ